MLGSLGWDRLFPLLVAALVVLGPERLPGAVRWAA
jgi:sec-independent protein translocase protein TatB